MREFIAAIAGISVTYLAFAFVKAEIDFTLWPEITRGVCAITAVIVAYVAAAFTALIMRDTP